MAKLNIKPKQVTKRLLSALPDRARDVVVGRYGLDDGAERLTLEAIGQKYGITRERVRQIENHALTTIRKSDVFQTEKEAFVALQQAVDEMGGIVPEDKFLEAVAKDESTRNHIHFLLVLGDPFTKEKESTEFYHRWHVNTELATQVHDALRSLYKKLSDDDLIPESEMVSRFLGELKEVNEKYRNDEILCRWLGLCKQLGRNPLGEWGKANSSNVRAKGMRDYAYLAIKRHGSPMHFTEVAKAIEELFSRKAHVATTHNELIKDNRFVLVGRGLYALSEWGYSAGVVKDVIRELLSKQGPLSRDEIIDRVRKERYVKDNTILVNLQDANLFGRDTQGKYFLIS